MFSFFHPVVTIMDPITNLLSGSSVTKPDQAMFTPNRKLANREHWRHTLRNAEVTSSVSTESINCLAANLELTGTTSKRSVIILPVPIAMGEFTKQQDLSLDYKKFQVESIAFWPNVRTLSGLKKLSFGLIHWRVEISSINFQLYEIDQLSVF